MSRSIFFIN